MEREQGLERGFFGCQLFERRIELNASFLIRVGVWKIKGEIPLDHYFNLFLLEKFNRKTLSIALFDFCPLVFVCVTNEESQFFEKNSSSMKRYGRGCLPGEFQLDNNKLCNTFQGREKLKER